MVTQIIRDPLLTAAKGVLFLAQILMGIGFSACAVGLAAMLVAPGRVAAEIGGPAGPEWSWAIPLMLALLVAFIALAFVFVEELRRIIRTVERGDPFVPANAARLNRMGWYAVGALVVQFPLGFAADVVEQAPQAGEGGSTIVTGDFSLESLVLALVLFVLARVFRHGAAMREDLEGTV